MACAAYSTPGVERGGGDRSCPISALYMYGQDSELVAEARRILVEANIVHRAVDRDEISARAAAVRETLDQFIQHAAQLASSLTPSCFPSPATQSGQRRQQRKRRGQPLDLSHICQDRRAASRTASSC